jgi:hypothetical protein
VGKTRLCEEFISDAAAKNTLVLRSKCQFFDKDMPLAPLRDAVNYLLEVATSSPNRDVLTKRILAASVGLEAQLGLLSKRFQKFLLQNHALKEVESNNLVDQHVFLNSGIRSYSSWMTFNGSINRLWQLSRPSSITVLSEKFFYFARRETMIVANKAWYQFVHSWNQ